MALCYKIQLEGRVSGLRLQDTTRGQGRVSGLSLQDTTRGQGKWAQATRYN